MLGDNHGSEELPCSAEEIRAAQRRTKRSTGQWVGADSSNGYGDGALRSEEERDTGTYTCILATAIAKLEPTTQHPKLFWWWKILAKWLARLLLIINPKHIVTSSVEKDFMTIKYSALKNTGKEQNCITWWERRSKRREIGKEKQLLNNNPPEYMELQII